MGSRPLANHSKPDRERPQKSGHCLSCFFFQRCTVVWQKIPAPIHLQLQKTRPSSRPFNLHFCLLANKLRTTNNPKPTLFCVSTASVDRFSLPWCSSHTVQVEERPGWKKSHQPNRFVDASSYGKWTSDTFPAWKMLVFKQRCFRTKRSSDVMLVFRLFSYKKPSKNPNIAEFPQQLNHHLGMSPSLDILIMSIQHPRPYAITAFMTQNPWESYFYVGAVERNTANQLMLSNCSLSHSCVLYFYMSSCWRNNHPSI